MQEYQIQAWLPFVYSSTVHAWYRVYDVEAGESQLKLKPRTVVLCYKGGRWQGVILDYNWPDSINQPPRLLSASRNSLFSSPFCLKSDDLGSISRSKKKTCTFSSSFFLE